MVFLATFLFNRFIYLQLSGGDIAMDTNQQ
jgi:hypothetical protein